MPGCVLYHTLHLRIFKLLVLMIVI